MKVGLQIDERALGQRYPPAGTFGRNSVSLLLRGTPFVELPERDRNA